MNNFDDLESLIKNTVEKYRANFNYLRRELSKMNEKQKFEAIRIINLHFNSCKKIEMFPEPETCLDILNEIKEI